MRSDREIFVMMKEKWSFFLNGFPSFLLNICGCKLKWVKKRRLKVSGRFLVLMKTLLVPEF